MQTTPKEAEKSVAEIIENLKTKGILFKNPLRDGAGTYICTKPQEGEGFILIRNFSEMIIVAFHPPDTKGLLLAAVDEAIEAKTRTRFSIPKEGITSLAGVQALSDNLASALVWYNSMWQYVFANQHDLSEHLDTFVGLAASHAKMTQVENME